MASVSMPGRRRGNRITNSQRRMLEGYFFVLPWLLGFALFFAWPLASSFYLSFNELKQASFSATTFVGLKNYQDAFLVDVEFLRRLPATFQNLAIDLPITLIFALIAAMLGNQKIPGVTLFRAVFFLPVVIGTALVIQELFNQNVGSNLFGGSSGLDIQALLANFLTADQTRDFIMLLNRLVFVLWQTGIPALIFMAGLKSIPPSLYEAAKVDGASGWEIFWKVTLPMISPVILVNIIFIIVNNFTDVFNPVLAYIKQTAFSGQFRFGYAAAMGWIYFLMIFVVLAVVIGVVNRWVYYAGEKR